MFKRLSRTVRALVNAATCTSYYINTLIDMRKGNFPLLDALRELRSLHNIGDKPI